MTQQGLVDVGIDKVTLAGFLVAMKANATKSPEQTKKLLALYDARACAGGSTLGVPCIATFGCAPSLPD